MKEYNVLQYGAVGDGATNDAFAIQHAIDDCAKNGGGRVVLQSGYVFYSDSIRLRSNVDLHIQKGARLKATGNIDGYIRPNKLINDPKTALIGNPVTGKPSFVFLYGYEADGCTISGEGTIDANGHAFVQRKDQYYVTGDFYPRPTVIYVEKSNHITFKDITIVDAPFWTLHPAGCDDVLIDRIRILNDLDVANSDGIDPDHCSNVRILGCHVECADDCICLKASKGNAEYGPCENIIIDGCTLVSTSAAIKIGTEGVGDFRNVLVQNCVISRSVKQLDGAQVFGSVEEFLGFAEKAEGKVFVLGGGEIYRELLPYCGEAFITRIYESFNGDVFFTDLEHDRDWEIVETSPVMSSECRNIRFFHYIRKK